MKIILSIIIILNCYPYLAFAVEDDHPSVAVCFTPNEACDNILIDAINKAEKTIRMASYSFTSEKIADALIEARKRDIKVWLVMDKGQLTAKKSQGKRLSEAGIGVRYDFKHAIQHNKYVIIDIQTTATGSYNFSDSAQNRNAENMIFIDDKKIAQEYADNWGFHWSHSVKE